MRLSGVTLLLFLATVWDTLPSSKAQNDTTAQKSILNFRIQALPDTILEGATEESEVRCDYVGPSTLFSIALVKTNKSSKNVETLSHVAVNQPKQVMAQNGIKAGQTSGEIKADGQSGYLSIKWSSPGQHQGGLYKCQVVALVGGRFVKTEKSARVRVNRATMEDLLRIVGSLKDKVRTLQGEVGSVKGEVGSVEGKVGTLYGQIGSLQGEVRSVNGEVGSVKGEVGSVKGEVGSVKGKVSTLQGEMGSVKGKVSTLQGEMGSVKGKVSTLQGEMASVKGKVSTLQGEMGSVKGKESTLQGKVGSLTGQVGSVKGKVSTLQGEVGSVKGTVSTLQGEVGSVKGTVSTLQGEVGSVKGDIRTLKAFSPSTSYKSHTYYLKLNLPLTSTNAQTFCQGMGGYLAEINTRGEYQVIVRFASKLMKQGVTSILLGGSDAAREGTWVFDRTKTHVPFFDLGPGQPDNWKNNEDCLSITNYWKRNWKMNDMTCNLASVSFLCEVPA